MGEYLQKHRRFYCSSIDAKLKSMTHERCIMGIPCTARRHCSTKESPLLQKSFTHSLYNLRKGPQEACKFQKSPESYKILMNFSNLRTFLFFVKGMFESKGNSYRTPCNVGFLINSNKDD